MHLYVVESLGVLIAAIIPNFILGLIVFCSALSQMFVFNGFFISVENMPKVRRCAGRCLCSLAVLLSRVGTALAIKFTRRLLRLC